MLIGAMIIHYVINDHIISLSVINIVNIIYRTTCDQVQVTDLFSYNLSGLSANVSQANGVAGTFELTLDSFALQWMLKYTICKEILFFNTFIIVEVDEVHWHNMYLR